MGYFEILQAGEWDDCDRCSKPKPKLHGRYEGGQGINLIWICADCL